MKRILHFIILGILIIISLTGCSDDSVIAKYNDDEISIYSERDRAITVKFTVKDGEKEFVDSKQVELLANSTLKMNVEQLAPNFFTSDAVITSLEVNPPDPAMMLFCILFAVVFLGSIFCAITE